MEAKLPKVNRVFVYPWKDKSFGARQVSEGLDASRIRLVNSKFQAKDGDVVINWGASEIENPEVRKCRLINTPTNVNRAANKLEFFQAMSRAEDAPRIPQFTTNLDEAVEWIREKGTVVARTKLRARSGTDIVFFDKSSEFVKAPLYTRYIKKKEEYRVHIVFGKVVRVQQKALRNDVDKSTVDFRIRNLQNGFIFKVLDLHTPDDVITQAEKAYRASGLHFAAIDVIWNEHEKQAYVLEANTAPGLEGGTVDSYIAAFKEGIYA